MGAEPIGVVAERTGRMLLKILHEAGRVVELSAAHEAVSAHHGNNYTPLMERFYRSHRATLFALLEVIDLESTSTDHRVFDVLRERGLADHAAGSAPAGPVAAAAFRGAGQSLRSMGWPRCWASICCPASATGMT